VSGCRPPTAVELLRALAVMRGWAIGNGLPDEGRAGRQILKDYCAGKLPYFELPPGSSGAGAANSHLGRDVLLGGCYSGSFHGSTSCMYSNN
jgi:hypothetical protein